MSFDRIIVLGREDVRETRLELRPYYYVKATAADTNGAFTLRMTHVRKSIRRHTHIRVDESFFMLEGELNVHFGAEGVRVENVTPGMYVFMPHGVPHAIELLSPEGARMIAVSTPGGDEAFLEEIVESINRLGRKDDTHPEYIEMARRHGIIFDEPEVSADDLVQATRL